MVGVCAVLAVERPLDLRVEHTLDKHVFDEYMYRRMGELHRTGPWLPCSRHSHVWIYDEGRSRPGSEKTCAPYQRPLVFQKALQQDNEFRPAQSEFLWESDRDNPLRCQGLDATGNGCPRDPGNRSE